MTTTRTHCPGSLQVPTHYREDGEIREHGAVIDPCAPRSLCPAGCGTRRFLRSDATFPAHNAPKG
jgi:hypothetical protein